MSTDSTARAWMEVSGAALLRNLERVRSAAGPEVALIPMVKANAYGLGVANALALLETREPHGYGVATVAEGVELRRLGVQRPVVVFSPVAPQALQVGVEAGLTFGVSSMEALQALQRLSGELEREVEIHIEVDTGMGRAGFPVSFAPELGAAVAASGLRWKGVFTHFHSAEDDSPSSVQEQVARFDEALGHLALPADPDFLVHLCNSAAAVRYPELARHAVRPGILLYGGLEGAEPVVSVRARISHVRTVEAGTSAGYGATYRSREAERWGTVSIGYGDGIRRSLAHGGHALVRGRRVPILGRISMDMTVVDISDVAQAGWGDVVTFLGSDGDESISLHEMAAQAGTISYELLTGFTPRLPRIWQSEER